MRATRDSSPISQPWSFRGCGIRILRDEPLTLKVRTQLREHIHGCTEAARSVAAAAERPQRAFSMTASAARTSSRPCLTSGQRAHRHGQVFPAQPHGCRRRAFQTYLLLHTTLSTLRSLCILSVSQVQRQLMLCRRHQLCPTDRMVRGSPHTLRSPLPRLLQ